MQSQSILLLLMLISNFSDFCNSVAIDNDIVGEPKVECLADRIRFKAKVRKPFSGRIFAKGKATDIDCSKTGYAIYRTSEPSYDVNLGVCGMRSLRSLEPKGMFYGITIVLSFHPLIITKVDKAFHVKCFFDELDKTVNAELGVSMLPTTETTGISKSPICTYSIHKGGGSQSTKGGDIGPSIQYAQIGDKASVASLRLFINGNALKSCYVTDGLGQRADVIDAQGCPVDPILITGIHYSSNLTQAQAESHVFKPPACSPRQSGFAGHPAYNTAGPPSRVQQPLATYAFSSQPKFSPARPQSSGNLRSDINAESSFRTTESSVLSQAGVLLFPENELQREQATELTNEYDARHEDDGAAILPDGIIFENGDTNGVTVDEDMIVHAPPLSSIHEDQEESDHPAGAPSSLSHRDSLLSPAIRNSRFRSLLPGYQTASFNYTVEDQAAVQQPLQQVIIGSATKLQKADFSGLYHYNRRLRDEAADDFASYDEHHQDSLRQLSRQLIIYDLDEDPPEHSHHEMLAVAPFYGNVGTTDKTNELLLRKIYAKNDPNADDVAWINHKTKSPQQSDQQQPECVITSRGFSALLASLLSLIVLLLFVVCLMCVCHRQMERFGKSKLKSLEANDLQSFYNNNASGNDLKDMSYSTYTSPRVEQYYRK